MAFLVIAGQTIPVDMADFKARRVEIGETGRAFDGSARSSVRARKTNLPIATKWIPTATADTIVAALEGSPPLAASGDLTGPINVIVTGIERTHRKFSAGEYQRLSFLVMEA